MLIINMGGEMIYILEQRLNAQSIPSDKATRGMPCRAKSRVGPTQPRPRTLYSVVLHDVVRTMYSPRFIGELFRSQEMYSVEATRQIFDRLAHSSIMRLNKASMDKVRPPLSQRLHST